MPIYPETCISWVYSLSCHPNAISLECNFIFICQLNFSPGQVQCILKPLIGQYTCSYTFLEDISSGT